MAMKAAVEKVIIEAAREGRLIHVWQDGAVAEVSVEELRELSTRILAE